MQESTRDAAAGLDGADRLRVALDAPDAFLERRADDPSLAASWDLAGLEFHYATCAKLYNYPDGAVITADVTLSSDLYCPASDGLSIQAANVTIDLAGHTISGNGSGVGDLRGSGWSHNSRRDYQNFDTGIDEPFFIGDALLVDGWTHSTIGDGVFTTRTIATIES